MGQREGAVCGEALGFEHEQPTSVVRGGEERVPGKGIHRMRKQPSSCLLR